MSQRSPIPHPIVACRLRGAQLWGSESEGPMTSPAGTLSVTCEGNNHPNQQLLAVVSVVRSAVCLQLPSKWIGRLMTAGRGQSMPEDVAAAPTLAERANHKRRGTISMYLHVSLMTVMLMSGSPGETSSHQICDLVFGRALRFDRSFLKSMKCHSKPS